MTVGELLRTMARINVALENRQAEYQTSMVEVEGMINQTPITILIDPGASLSYISPKMVEKCNLPVEKIENSWLVQLATGAKRKKTCFVKECTVVMDQFENVVKLNVLPLGSYELLIGMDWLEQHRVILNCYDKAFTCITQGLHLVNLSHSTYNRGILKNTLNFERY